MDAPPLMPRARIALVALLLALPACRCSHVGVAPAAPSIPVVPVAPPAPETGPVVTLSVTASPGGGPLHVVTMREGHDPVAADVPAHPSAADLAPVLAGLTPDARVIVSAGEGLPYASLVALLDALRAAGFTRFALSR